MTEIEILNKKFDDFLDIEIELCNMCIDFIIKRLSPFPNKEISFDRNALPVYIKWYEYCGYKFLIVNRVFLIDWDIHAIADDGNDCVINDIDAIDLYRIAKAISSITEK